MLLRRKYSNFADMKRQDDDIERKDCGTGERNRGTDGLQHGTDRQRHGMAEAVHPLTADAQPPRRFTYPFCYEPHRLCVIAADEVRRYIAAEDRWQEEIGRGKMFGVLVVETGDGSMAFLAAYSGLLGGRCDWPWFVPPVFDSQQPDGYFKRREAEISAVNRQIDCLEADPRRQELEALLDKARSDAEREINIYKVKMAEAKRQRDLRRARGETGEELLDESRFMKAELRRIRQRHAATISSVGEELRRKDEVLARLKERRRNMSDDLQQWLFGQYIMLDARGGRRPLTDIFAKATGRTPPSGAGDCCAPKLLQYAYRLGLRPLCMAEFWWGESPQNEIRHHLHYYPACRGKCGPILEYMLQGLDVDPDPLANGTDDAEPEIIYEDGSIAVVCKPAGMLTVPGKGSRRSVLSVMRQRYPDADGPMIVHRLDMATSGLLVVAKTAAAYRNLQAQFAARTVKKKYVALLQGTPETGNGHLPASDAGHENTTNGTMSHVKETGESPLYRCSLPIRPDPLDRPRQVVDRERGRTAVTEYRISGTDGHGRTRIELYPLTGRTHQLRVHCAHPDGLNAPIAGDGLYGKPAERLYLHAESIGFDHPVTGRRMTFERKADF